MKTVATIAELREALAELRRSGGIALVPTMGALHDGHLALVRAARELAPSVVVSIFVNPAQFGPNEDFDAYPRRLENDATLLETEGVDLLWAPSVAEIYPQGFATTVSVAGVSEGLCGAVRPGHFAGVATVVLKLFSEVEPDFAIFGEKDWQQLAVIRRMARDLDLTHPTAENVVGVPTVREEDGLAMSSRNAYLSTEERAIAAHLPRAMRFAIARIEKGEPLLDGMDGLEAALLASGFDSVDYALVADSASLEPIDELGAAPARLLVAARIGGTRLIDNMPVEAQP
jgi:pantoate--beta-alanine ligase